MKRNPQRKPESASLSLLRQQRNSKWNLQSVGKTCLWRNSWFSRTWSWLRKKCASYGPAKGMIRRGKGAKNKVVKPVVDGKQKILANEYTIVTVGFVVSSAKVTRAKVFKRKSAHVHTSTQEPFLQALVDSKSAENMQRIFESACSLAHEHAGLDLRKQVWQVHKDYAWGHWEGTHSGVPQVAPVKVIPHMRRASYLCLRSLLKKTQVSTPQDRGVSGRGSDVWVKPRFDVFV